MSQPYESAVDRAIREAAERGAFENLPGRGKPLPHLDEDELGWVGAERLRRRAVGPSISARTQVRRWMDRESVSRDMLLPPSVQLRKEIDRLPETLAELRTEAAVREHVLEVNRRVVEHLRFPSGPRVPVRPVDADAAVARWRADRARPTAVAPAPAAATADPPARRPSRWPSWWRRR